jgi:hypothetical protein
MLISYEYLNLVFITKITDLLLMLSYMNIEILYEYESCGNFSYSGFAFYAQSLLSLTRIY